MNSTDIFLERMAILVYIDKKPFCYRDFLKFELNGTEHRFAHGTIRNIFSQLRKDGKIERVYQSFQTFYTLTGTDVGKPITPNHGEDHLNHKQKGFMQFLKQLPMDVQAIHNIRLRFECKGLWSILSSSSSSDLISNKDLNNNKDITLKDIDLKTILLKLLFTRPILLV